MLQHTRHMWRIKWKKEMLKQRSRYMLMIKMADTWLHVFCFRWWAWPLLFVLPFCVFPFWGLIMASEVCSTVALLTFRNTSNGLELVEPLQLWYQWERHFINHGHSSQLRTCRHWVWACSRTDFWRPGTTTSIWTIAGKLHIATLMGTSRYWCTSLPPHC